MKYKNINELEKCPYCGNESYYTKGKIIRDNNSYKNVNPKLIAEFAYCTKCGKKIARLEKY